MTISHYHPSLTPARIHTYPNTRAYIYMYIVFTSIIHRQAWQYNFAIYVHNNAIVVYYTANTNL